MAMELKELVLSEPGMIEPDPARRGVQPGPYLLPAVTIVEPATPTDVLLGTLPDPEIRLQAPIHLEVQQEDDNVAVWSEELEEFGYGPHLTAAIEDFQQTVIELYHTLAAEQGHLGPGMVDLWARLQLFIERRP